MTRVNVYNCYYVKTIEDAEDNIRRMGLKVWGLI